MEKRIIFAFLISMLLVSLYNTLVLKPLSEKEISIKRSAQAQGRQWTQEQEESTLPAQLINELTQLDSGENEVAYSPREEILLSDGKAYVSKKGIVEIIQHVPLAQEDVRLSFFPPLGWVVGEQGFHWSIQGKENTLKMVLKNLEKPVWVVCGVLPPPRDLPKRYAKYYEGIIVQENGKNIRRLPLAKIKTGLRGVFSGIGLYSKYYLIYMWSKSGVIQQVLPKADGDKTILLGRIMPSRDGIIEIGVYAGLGRKEFMKGVPDVDKVIRRGVLSGITHVLWIVLKFLYSLTHNWGISIALLGVLFSLVFLPLTIRSYVAMKKLQAMEPEMKALQERYKNDPQRLNQELVLLYAKYGVNPLSGCLPLLLQLPVFFALYPLLLNTYEFKGSGFLWIKDLSQPDVVFSIGGFDVHLLPIIVVGIMVLQQRFSISGRGNQQGQIMMWVFPILFLLIFYNMPSGLVLFWLVMSLINIFQQWFVIRRI